MSFLQIFVLSLIQGITEFLPVSSSGHLALIPQITEWMDQGLIFDVAVHVGTLGAVMIYFWRDVVKMIGATLNLLRGKKSAHLNLVLFLIIGTLPVVVSGFIIHKFFPGLGRSAISIAWMSIIFGVLLYLADRYAAKETNTKELSHLKAFLIGAAQSIALVPGVSRSGIILTTARALKVDRVTATKFAFLLSIPAILGAATLTGFDLYKQEAASFSSMDLWIGVTFSFVFGLLAIRFMMWWMRSFTFFPFMVYRIVLGISLLLFIQHYS